MFCKFCEKEISEGQQFCQFCGKSQDQKVSVEQKVVVDHGGTFFIPNNAAALWGYYLGIASLLCGLTSIPALIMGIKGLQYKKAHPEARGGIHAWVGIILGGIMLLVMLVGVLVGVLACFLGAVRN